MIRLDIFFFNPVPKEEMLKDSIVVFDTNVLLHAYQWRGVTTRTIIEVMKLLSAQGRFKIPHQIIKEFFKTRPQRIADLSGLCHDKMSKLPEVENVLNLFPVFEGQEFFNVVIETQKGLSDAIKSYREKLKEVREKIGSLFDDDPVLNEYEPIFKSCVCGQYTPEDIKKLTEEAHERYKNNTPPGFKDKGKDDGGPGDYIIWATILSLGKANKKDVVFVTGETKPDWVITDKNGTILSARRELVEEFYKHCGKSFRVMGPKEIVEIVRPDTPEEVKTDLSIKNITFFKNNVLKAYGEGTTIGNLRESGITHYIKDRVLEEPGITVARLSKELTMLGLSHPSAIRRINLVKDFGLIIEMERNGVLGLYGPLTPPVPAGIEEEE